METAGKGDANEVIKSIDNVLNSVERSQNEMLNPPSEESSSENVIQEEKENTTKETSEPSGDEENGIESSESGKKALEILAKAEPTKEDVEETEVDINVLSKQIMDILNEGRADNDLNEQQLREKSADLQIFITKLIVVLRDKTEYSVRLERQNEALIHQAKSLKNVVNITKDLLNLRNMEVEHLHEDMKLMEENINAERTRHDLLLQKLSESMNLNEQLKAEYHKQNGLFQTLRDKYNEKILILMNENKRLDAIVKGRNEMNPKSEESKECPGPSNSKEQISVESKSTEQPITDVANSTERPIPGECKSINQPLSEDSKIPEPPLCEENISETSEIVEK